MNRLRLFRAAAVTALLMMFGLMLGGPMAASASSIEAPSVPVDIAVTDGSVVLFVNHARGMQIYECKNGQWAFHAPRANLFDVDTNQRTAIHYGGIDQGLALGPWWESLSDGSRVHGGNAVSAPSPTPGNIPWLRLKAVGVEGSGMFSNITYIQRLNTVGGVGPSGACLGNEQRWVVYTADYYFYGRP